MIVVTTPMCKQIVEWAGLNEFKLNKFPDEEEGDIAILLSESKVNMDSLTLKLNTFSQIRQSILKVSKFCYENDLTDFLISNEDIDEIFQSHEALNYANLSDDDFDKIRQSNSNKRIKVYSEFLKDIVLDIGAAIVNEEYSFVVYPDYLKELVSKEEDFSDSSIVFIEIPSHGMVSKNPLERTDKRYSILINGLND